MKAQIDAAWQAFHKEKAPGVRIQLMEKYLGLVHYVVNKLFNTQYFNGDREDLVNIGVIGLSEALDRYDPYFGIKFETYAIPRIRGAIIDELRKQDWVPRSLRAKSSKIKKSIEILEQTHRDYLCDSTVAKHLGISEKEYYHWQTQVNNNSMVSLDKPAAAAEECNLYEALEDMNTESPDKTIEDSEAKKLLVKAIRQLPEKARLAITLYYYERLTFKEIGEILNVSESRISQIHSETIRRLKKYITEQYSS